MTDKEARHLAMLAMFSKEGGEILEIGSFMGKSTTLLSLAAAEFSTNPKIVAVDPLTQPSETDPTTQDSKPSRDEFYANLNRAGIKQTVEFHEILSTQLANSWVRPISMLWIDGDHTVEGVLNDFENFAPFLIPNGLIAMHDVMHGFRGPDQVFIDKILRSDDFNAAGIVGSIGWAQKGRPSAQQKRCNEQLADRLQSWLDTCPPSMPATGLRKLWLKFKRSQVPHGAVSAEKLQTMLN